MKIYTGKDAFYEYLCDKKVARSGQMWELKLEVTIHNAIARVVNIFIKKYRLGDYEV